MGLRPREWEAAFSPTTSILVKCLFALAKHASSAQSNLLSCIVHFPVAICSPARSLTWLSCAPDIVQDALTSLYNIIFRKVTMFTKHNGLCSRGPNLPWNQQWDKSRPHTPDTLASVRASVDFVLPPGLQFGDFGSITKGITTYLMAQRQRHHAHNLQNNHQKLNSNAQRHRVHRWQDGVHTYTHVVYWRPNLSPSLNSTSLLLILSR